MNHGERISLDQIRAFLEASEDVDFRARNRAERYAWIGGVLREQNYAELGKAAKGLVRSYIEKMTGLSRAQTTRVIKRYQAGEEVKPRTYRRRRFPQRYTADDIELLVEVDTAHEALSGPATRKILYREFHDFGDTRFKRLSELSGAHLYRLRQSRAYRTKRTVYQLTRPKQVAIGERRKPDPRGRPGYLRIDTVHQGDRDGVKGLYHINAVDEVTQWEVVGATAFLSEAWLMPVLEAMLEQFPFQIRGFHSDNGSEFINDTVSTLLNKLLIEQTKSRPRHSNDNGLAETNNGAIIRKHIGYGHICSEHAEAFDRFYREYLNPYLNFHRPCGVPETTVDAKGKQRVRYRWYATPWEILRQLPGVSRFLRPDLTVDLMNATASAQSDTTVAIEMQEAKQALFEQIRRSQAKKTA
jgi:IS30 family transposase